jgi:hypothetical protein
MKLYDEEEVSTAAGELLFAEEFSPIYFGSKLDYALVLLIAYSHGVRVYFVSLDWPVVVQKTVKGGSAICSGEGARFREVR